jgi:hypothetical protein
MTQQEDFNLIEPDEIASGHDESDVQRIVRSVLDKLPPAESIAAIDLRLPRSRRRL